ncbi:hypothetical protein H4S07_000843, partial [Coemansia furcata]
MMRELLSTEEDSWRKSLLAYVAQFFVPRIRQRMADLRLRWIPGHKGNKGNKGNKAADKAAKDAQRQRRGWWMFCLRAPLEQPFWVCVGNSIVPYKTGGIVKRQEEAWASARLVRHVCLANGNADIREADLKELLEVLNWLAANQNRTWTHKHSWCLTNMWDSNLQGFVLGMIFGVLPVAEREWAWYPQAYQESEWKICPCCKSDIKTQEHYLTCMASCQILHLGVVTDELESQRLPCRQPQAMPVMAPQANRWTLIPIRMHWQKEYEECCLPRNAMQISKEEASAVKLKKRRALMCQSRLPDVVREDSMPTYPKELAVKKMDEYKKL